MSAGTGPGTGHDAPAPDESATGSGGRTAQEAEPRPRGRAVPCWLLRPPAVSALTGVGAAVAGSAAALAVHGTVGKVVVWLAVAAACVAAAGQARRLAGRRAAQRGEGN